MRPQSSGALVNYLTPIFDESCAGAAHIAVAVSGGADSMALTLLAQQWCALRKVQLTALTVDHGLRVESADEARQVHQWLAQHGIAHQTLTPKAPAITNTQTRAREMRFAVLAEWCVAHGATHVLLAHHADDQAETVALQQHRGETGPSRCGMALVRMHGLIRIVRPLLGVRKQVLVSSLEAAGQPWIEDPSNASDAYARNRLRQTMGEETMQALWHMARQQGRLRHDAEVEQKAWFAAYARAENDGVTFDLGAWRDAHEALRTDLLSYAIRHVGGKQHRPRYHETTHLDGRIRSETHGVSTLGHCIVRWKENLLSIRPEHTLAGSPSAPYMTSANTPKPLGNEPFWWFYYPPFNDGAARAPA